MTEQEFQELIEKLKNYFEPKTEISEGLPDVGTVSDMTQVIYEENNQTVIVKAINGQWKEIFRG